MNPPPGTRDEYSRGDRAFGGVFGGAQGGSEAVLGRGLRALAARPGRGPGRASEGAGSQPAPARLNYPRGLAWTILIAVLLGAAVLIVAEFSTLCTLKAATRTSLPACGHAGAHHGYALIPMALLAVVLGFAALGGAGRYAVIALGLVGLVALLIGLLHDLPAAQQARNLIRVNGRYLTVASSPGTGMYLETLGAVILIITAGLGLLFGQTMTRGSRAR
jgi:hypothetical protein